MLHHSLILTAKVAIPEDPGVDLVIQLINHGLTQVKYFGVEIDNPVNYLEEELDSRRLHKNLLIIRRFFF